MIEFFKRTKYEVVLWGEPETREKDEEEEDWTEPARTPICDDWEEDYRGDLHQISTNKWCSVTLSEMNGSLVMRSHPIAFQMEYDPKFRHLTNYGDGPDWYVENVPTGSVWSIKPCDGGNRECVVWKSVTDMISDDMARVMRDKTVPEAVNSITKEFLASQLTVAKFVDSIRSRLDQFGA